MFKRFFIVLAVALLALIGASAFRDRAKTPAPGATAAVKALQPTGPLAVVLTPHPGEGPADRAIQQLQSKLASASKPNPLLERLGWAYVAKARLSSDSGFYTLAEQAAAAINATAPADPGAALLLGHVYHAQHRFAEAEKIARHLISQREFAFDHALLGDVLMEQGKLAEAVVAYQRMVDLKPCLQTYSRVAHMRWLKGDVRGAEEASRLAVGAGSPREPEATAWSSARLALYQLQLGNQIEASLNVARALELAPDYAPALLVRGRMLLAQGMFGQAAEVLAAAAQISPLPEYFWTLAEGLRANGSTEEAERIEAKLVAAGTAADPRTLALFLSSYGRDLPLALRLASEELAQRRDVFSYDALAWAQLANGQVSEARENMHRALSEGTQDARLFYHAGSIAAAAGDNGQALAFFNQAHALQALLLPSEQKSLGVRTAALVEADGLQFSSTKPNSISGQN